MREYLSGPPKNYELEYLDKKAQAFLYWLTDPSTKEEKKPGSPAHIYQAPPGYCFLCYLKEDDPYKRNYHLRDYVVLPGDQKTQKIDITNPLIVSRLIAHFESNNRILEIEGHFQDLDQTVTVNINLSHEVLIDSIILKSEQRHPNI